MELRIVFRVLVIMAGGVKPAAVAIGMSPQTVSNYQRRRPKLAALALLAEHVAGLPPVSLREAVRVSHKETYEAVQAGLCDNGVSDHEREIIEALAALGDQLRSARAQPCHPSVR